MTADAPHFKPAILEAFLAFLDEQERLLGQTLERLNALRAAVIRRDEETLGTLLEQTRCDADRHRTVTLEQRALEQRLVEAIDGLSLPITLSRLCAALHGPTRTLFEQKQRALREIAHRVQLEYASTELLLRQCARCNRQLLDAIVGRSSRTLTYDAQGQSRREAHRGLVSVKL
jgi:hypothetical protein